MRALSHRRRPGRALRCYFATDLHGSDRCFRKFLAAATAYEAEVLILGGDIAGKAIVPIERRPNGRLRFRFMGAQEEVDESALPAAVDRIAFNGMYAWIATAEEIECAAADKAFRDRIFAEAITRQVETWVGLVEERLSPAKRIIITPGNDDPPFIDRILEASQRIECPERAVIQLGPVWLASLGSTTETPWKTHREFTEAQLTQQITDMVEPFADGRAVVFNFHCPPADTGLDTVIKLGPDLRPVVVGGAPVETSGGSVAVREAVLKYRPVVGLFGHVHEAAGAVRLGESWCINPGSDYSAGILKGVIVDFDASGRYMAHLLTQG